ncbi:hypothetical protein QTN25_000359 [Entamoeba marina]
MAKQLQQQKIEPPIGVGIDLGASVIKYSIKQGYNFTNKQMPNVMCEVGGVYFVGEEAKKKQKNGKLFIPRTIEHKALCYFLFFNHIQQETGAVYAVLTVSPSTPHDEVNMIWHIAQNVFGSANLVSMVASRALMFSEYTKQVTSSDIKIYSFLDFGAKTLHRSTFTIDGLNINIKETVAIDISEKQKQFEDDILDLMKGDQDCPEEDEYCFKEKIQELKESMNQKKSLIKLTLESGERTYKVSVESQNFEACFRNVFEEVFKKVMPINPRDKEQVFLYGKTSGLNACESMVQSHGYKFTQFTPENCYHASSGCCMISNYTPNFIDEYNRLSNMIFNVTVKPNTFTIECYRNNNKRDYYEEMYKYGESPLSTKEFKSSVNFPNKQVETQKGMLKVTGEFEGFIVLKQGNNVVAWTQEPIEKADGLYIELVKTLQVWQLPNQLFLAKTPKQLRDDGEHKKESEKEDVLLKRSLSSLVDFIIPFTNSTDGQAIHGEYPLLFKAIADEDIKLYYTLHDGPQKHVDVSNITEDIEKGEKLREKYEKWKRGNLGRDQQREVQRKISQISVKTYKAMVEAFQELGFLGEFLESLNN